MNLMQEIEIHSVTPESNCLHKILKSIKSKKYELGVGVCVGIFA